MFKLLAVLAIGAAAANASLNLFIPVEKGFTPATSVFARQSIDALLDQIPSACSSICDSSVPIIQACDRRDVDGCLKLCAQNAYDSFINCQNCLLKEEKDHVYTAAEVRFLQQSKQTIENGCRQTGSAVQSKELEIPGVDSSTRYFTSGTYTGLGRPTTPPSQSSNGGPDPSSTPQTATAAGAPAASTTNAASMVVVQAGGVLGGIMTALLAVL